MTRTLPQGKVIEVTYELESQTSYMTFTEDTLPFSIKYFFSWNQFVHTVADLICSIWGRGEEKTSTNLPSMSLV